MFRRRQEALIASLASAAVVGLVVPAATSGAVVGSAAAKLAAVASVAGVSGEATPESAVEPAASDEAVEQETAEPAQPSPQEPGDEPPTTSAPEPEPAENPTTEPAPADPPATEPTSTDPPADEPIGATTTTAPVDASPGDEPGDEPTTPDPEPGNEPDCEATTEPATDVTTEDTASTPAPDPLGEPDCESVAATTTTTPTDEESAPTSETTPTDEESAPTSETTPTDEESAPTSTTTPTDEESAPTSTTTAPPDASDREPAVDPATEPAPTTTVPEPVDETVDGATILPSDDEPSDVATVDETAQTAEPTDEADDGESSEAVEQLDAPVAPTPIDTTPAELNTYDPGLRASVYDGVYAEGVPVGVAMATTRWLESGNRYDARARGSTASGAYQILDSTWNRYGGYPRAYLAPPDVQDQFAYEAFTALLKRHGNDVSTIPVSWYIGHVPQGAEWDTVPHPEAGNTLTPRQYQSKWMKKFFSLLSEGAPVYLPSDTEALIPAIAFPVLGPVGFVDDWHFERDGGARRHEGLDLLGYEGQPIRAVFDGVITMIDDDPSGIAGNGLRLTRDDGLYANYFHLSNSETGPVHPTLEVGTRVRAGQIIGFMGSTGNAGIPHLHFELRTAEREPMAPYPAVLEAIQREQCTVGLGPWSTEFTSPAERAEAEAAALEALADLTDEEVEELRDLAEAAADEIEYFTIEGPDGAQWVIGTDGSVTASGEAAMIGTYQTDCPMPVDTTDDQGAPIMYGTEAEGLPVDELPVGWWDDDAVEWKPDLDDDESYVDPWELDQADLDVDDENHVDAADVAAPLADRRFLDVR